MNLSNTQIFLAFFSKDKKHIDGLDVVFFIFNDETIGKMETQREKHVSRTCNVGASVAFLNLKAHNLVACICKECVVQSSCVQPCWVNTKL